MPNPQLTTTLKKWNRRIHIWLGLYMLLFLWVFAVSGLFMNHPGWFNVKPDRLTVEQPIMMPATGTNLEKAHDIMDQMNLTGEVVFRGQMPAGKFNFIVLRPNVRQFVNIDLGTSNASLTRVEPHFAGMLGDLHVFTGTRGIFQEKESVRDWLPTRIWSFSMDALAVGLIIMVLSSLYMGWQQWRSHRIGVVLSLTLGVAVFTFFVWGLAWLG